MTATRLPAAAGDGGMGDASFVVASGGGDGDGGGAFAAVPQSAPWMPPGAAGHGRGGGRSREEEEEGKIKCAE